MSVINRMLKDLDKRGGLGPRDLEADVRNADRGSRARRELAPGKIAAVIVVLGLGAFAAWHFLSPPPQPGVVSRKADTKTLAAKAPPVTPKPAAEAKPAREAKPDIAPKPAAASPEAPPAPAPAQAATSATPTAVGGTTTEQKHASLMAALPDDAKAAVALSNAALKSRTEMIPKLEAASRPTPAETEAPKTARVVPLRDLPPPPAERISMAPVKPQEAPKPAPEPRVSIERAERPLSGPPRAAAEYRSASDHFAQGRPDAAQAAYAEALRHDPTHVPARQSLVVMMLEQGRSAEAQHVLRDGIAAVPRNVAWPMLLARLQVEGGDPKAALETLERSLPQAGDEAEYRAFVATLMQMQSRHREAIAHYEASLRKAPNSGRWLTGLAISLEAEKRIPEAADAYRKALATPLTPDLQAFAERKLRQFQ